MKETAVQPAVQPVSKTAIKPVSVNGKSASASSPIKLVEQTADYQEPLIIALYGKYGTGKTRLCATGPGNIGGILLDRKAKKTLLDTAAQLGKRVFTPDVDLVRTTNPLAASIMQPYCKKKNDGEMNGQAMDLATKQLDIFAPQPDCCAIHHYRWHVQRVKYSLIELAESAQVQTIVIDSGSVLWDDILFANHGRTSRINPMDRMPDNREMKEIFDICYGRHLIITQKEKEVWVNNKPTGKFEYAGWAHLGYEATAIIYLSRDEKTGEFYADFENCNSNAALIGDGGKHDVTGLIDDMISMPEIGRAMYPNVTEEQYGEWM